MEISLSYWWFSMNVELFIRVNIGSDTSFLPVWRQAITWSNAANGTHGNKL